MTTFKATVYVTTAGNQRVLVETTVNAANLTNARWLLEAQYGKGNVCHIQPI